MIVLRATKSSVLWARVAVCINHFSSFFFFVAYLCALRMTNVSILCVLGTLLKDTNVFYVLQFAIRPKGNSLGCHKLAFGATEMFSRNLMNCAKRLSMLINIDTKKRNKCKKKKTKTSKQIYNV